MKWDARLILCSTTSHDLVKCSDCGTKLADYMEFVHSTLGNKSLIDLIKKTLVDASESTWISACFSMMLDIRSTCRNNNNNNAVSFAQLDKSDFKSI